MKCNRCGFDNPDYLEYCQNCTAPLDKKTGEDGKEPAWGFVKAPKWAKPDFSADTVSDDDIPEDFVQEAKHYANTAADAAGVAAVGAAAAAAGKAAKAGKKAQDKAEGFADDFADEYGDELDDIDDEFEEYKKRYDKPAKRTAAGVFDKLKSGKKNTSGKAAKFAEADDDELDDYDDFDDDDFDSNYKRSGGSGGSANLGTAIKVAAVVAALAVLAAGLWLIIKSAKGCSNKEKTYDPPVVEAGEDGSFYYVTIHAPEGTQLVYETTDGGRTPYTVPETCVAKFKVPVSGLMPGEPIDGATYYATPRVLTIDENGTETPINIDKIAIPVPQLGLTLDNEDEIVTEDGKATISGRIDYINALVTVNDEPVEVAADGSFSKEFVFDDVGSYDIEVAAKLANYQIAKHAVKVTVNAPVTVDPDAVIQMPWDYGDNTFSQRIVNSLSSIDVRGKVPAGSTVTASIETNNATITKPTVDDDGTFHFTLTMQFAGDYTVTIGCTTADGKEYSRDVHLQRQPDYSPYINGAIPADYSAFSFGTSQQYKIAGTVSSIEHEGDYYLAKFELTDGHIIVIEYHPHYGSAGKIELGKSYSNIYGRSKGFDENGNILFYVWFIND